MNDVKKDEAKLLKNVYNRAYIERLAKELGRAGLDFDQPKFCDVVMDQAWPELELKERTTKICYALSTLMPQEFKAACKILIDAGQSFGGYEGMFFPEYVQRFGLGEDWQLVMETLEVLTTYSSAEFAIRPFLEKDPIKGAKQMLSWAHHENEHVRRLASEGIRPRLPWASQLKYFRENPQPIFKILDILKEDGSLYVRKSVANNLNDISKDHPELALRWAKSAVTSKHPHTQWIVKHGLRTLLKSGTPQAMDIFGYAKRDSFHAHPFEMNQKDVALGEDLELFFSLEVKEKGLFRFEYALHFLKKNGTHTKKVFKISERELEPGEYEVDKIHSFKKINTRVYHEGLHFIEPLINGEPVGRSPFYLWNERPPYVVYMILTQKNTIYCGITTDISRRFGEHQGRAAKGAKYTKVNRPRDLIYLEAARDRSLASKREAALKKLTRSQKEQLSFLNLLI